MGAVDFAGGTVVHVAAGVGALAAILALRKRLGYPEHAIHPNSVVLSLVGAGLLWFGWFGFNGGSGLGSGAQAGAALTATQVAAAAAALTWTLIEWIHRGKPTGLGLATGLVAGLVAVTPASGYVTPLGAMAIGVAAGVVCYGFVIAKPWLKYDDSLDAFGVHGVGGALGAILTGVFASAALYAASTGLPPEDSTFALSKLGPDGSDRLALILAQLKATATAAVFSFVLSFVLVKGIDLTIGFCLTPADENLGLDRAEHGEVGFDFSLGADLVAETALPEPRPAVAPPNGQQRFTLVLDGIDPAEATRVWTELNRPDASAHLPPEYRQLYPYLTTVQGNRFRFRSGDPAELGAALERLFEAKAKLGGKRPRAQKAAV
jgi:Amt family ammonium transporter